MNKEYSVDERIESETVRRIKLGDREIILCGTAHISKESVVEVERLIREEKPGRVCIEIDAARFKSLKEGQNWSSLNIGHVLKNGQAFLMLASLVLSAYQRRLGMDVGSKQGQEMLIAADLCEELNLQYSFSDRDLQTTLRRAWSKSSFFQKMKMLGALIGSAFTNEKLSEEELESLKQKTALQTMMDELADYLPAVKEVFIDERDQFLATNIFLEREDKVLAVVGAGHMDGIVQWLEKLETGEKKANLEEVSVVPPKNKWISKIPWLITIAVVALIASGFIRNGAKDGFEMLLVWILANGTLSAIGSIIALAHPLTIVISFLAAPFTSMNPTIGVGIVTGLIQAWIRKPRIEDLENLNTDISSIKGFYKNRLTKVLLVFFLSSIGSSIGTFVALPYLTALIVG
ncbi:MAG: TraB/GumN family protein [Spirochaetales bacterium]|nr:TraB/GumN family protein [Spirochaetales bacterium]